MSDRVSALAGASFKGFVKVREAGLRGMVTFRGDLGAAKIKSALKAACGAPVPGQRAISGQGAHQMLWMSPDELLILCPYAQADDLVASLGQKLSGQHATLANVSDARALFQIEGPLWREALMKLTPADLHPDHFTAGTIRRSRVGQVAAAFWQDEHGVSLICFRSVAPYVMGLLSNAAQPGSEPGI